MRKLNLHLFLIVALVACGPKVSKSPENIMKEVEVYTSKIDKDKGVKNEILEGALTDNEGFKDIGKFKYTVFFNEDTKELLKIENIEITDKTVKEVYYFESNQLTYFESTAENSKTKKIYFYKGKAVPSENVTSEEQKLFIAKSKRFQKAFRETY